MNNARYDGDVSAMKRYRVRRIESDFDVDGALTKPVWDHADAARIDQYPWHRPGDPVPPRVEARLLYSSNKLGSAMERVRRKVIPRVIATSATVTTPII